MDVLGWLLDGDPAIRWQVLHDLVDAPAEQVAAERARVETDGWGARLLSLGIPTASGTAARASRDASPTTGGPASARLLPRPPWTWKVPTLMLLHDLGLAPESQAARETIPSGRGELPVGPDGQAFFDGEVEACINGRTLSIGAYFDGMSASSQRSARRPARAQGDLRAAARGADSLLGRHDDDGPAQARRAADDRGGAARRSTRSSSPPAAPRSTPGWSRSTPSSTGPGSRARWSWRTSSATATRSSPGDTLVVAISQSGETADTLMAIRHAREQRVEGAGDLQHERLDDSA